MADGACGPAGTT
jgi:hypothetical protein